MPFEDTVRKTGPTGIQVQRFDADAADAADLADRSWRRELSSRNSKAICFCCRSGGFNAPGAISPIRSFRRIRYNL
jgi:hypothetical protein